MPARFFEVSAVEEDSFVKVKCVCQLCGFVIIGNASDGIEDKQREHMESTHPEEAKSIRN